MANHPRQRGRRTAASRRPWRRPEPPKHTSRPVVPSDRWRVMRRVEPGRR